MPCRDALGDIEHRRTRPYRPQTNGKVERFHRTLADEWAYARLYTSEADRCEEYPAWLHTYNHHRGHTALGGQPPASRVPNLTGQYSSHGAAPAGSEFSSRLPQHFASSSAWPTAACRRRLWRTLVESDTFLSSLATSVSVPATRTPPGEQLAAETVSSALALPFGIQRTALPSLRRVSTRTLLPAPLFRHPLAKSTITAL